MSVFRKAIVSAVWASLFLSSHSYAAVSPDGIWLDASAKGAVTGNQEYRTISANTDRLSELLKGAPKEGRDIPAQEFFLPHPNGSFIRLGAYEYSVMAPELQAQFPDIRTYKVYGLDDPGISGRVDFSIRGFHGMLSTSEGRLFIEPETNFNKSGAKNIFRSFNRAKFKGLADRGSCAVADHDHSNRSLLSAGKVFSGSAAAKQAGDNKRTYRLAMAATAEYTAAVSSGVPSVAEAQASIVTAVNRLNQIFEKEVSVGFTLIANNSSIVFTDAATDGYTQSDHDTLNDNNQARLDAVIGSANYDIGHVLSTVGGGLAGLGVVCDGTSGTNRKARGSTGSSSPTGDAFIVDLLAHEIGHQLGASHSFNASGGAVSDSGSCSGNRANNTGGGNNFGAASAYEPGSGSTIMAYAGICRDQNIQNDSDAYFHARSLEQMREFVNGEVPFSNIKGNACGTETPTGNTPPTANAGADYTIPANTPFALTGSATDSDAGDVASITYTWEQYDLGAATGSLTQMHTDLGSGPLVRSRAGSTSPTRYIPSLDAILAGNLTANKGERLPTTDRQMNFRLTVRSGSQGFNQDDMVVTVDKDTGPFAVTAPTAGMVPGLSSMMVNWNVANTTAAPVSCTNVEISMSSDGGQTFPTVLLASTPNDGSESVTVPNSATTQGRIKVQCQGNIFFNVSPANFTVTQTGGISISATSTNLAEGNSGNTAFVFTVSRTGSTAATASVNYAVTGSSANPANAADFGGALPSGTVSLGVGESSKTLTINVTGDTDVESTEQFTVTISNPVNAVIGIATATGSIQADDGAVSIVATSADKLEGNSGVTTFIFTLSRSGNVSGAASVNYTVAGSGVNAADASDFGGVLPSGTVSFAANETTRTIVLSVSGDTAVENNEAFTVTISNPVGVVLGTTSAGGVIQNDDTAPVVTTPATPSTPTSTTSTDSGGGGGGGFGGWGLLLLIPWLRRIKKASL